MRRMCKIKSKIPRENPRALPHSRPAECALLGAILNGNVHLPKISTFLSPDEFYLPNHIRIFEAMLAIEDRRDPVDITILQDELGRGGMLAEVGGIDYLVRLSSMASSMANVYSYADIIKKTAQIRSVMKASQDIIDRGQSAAKADEDFFEYAWNHFSHAMQNRRVSPFSSIADELEVFFKRLDAVPATPLGGVTETGFDNIDRLLGGGLTSGNLIVLAGRPSVGKTSFALNIAENASSLGVQTLIFSLGMSKEQVTKRFLSSLGSVNLHKLHLLVAGKHDDHDFVRRMMVAADKIHNKPILIEDAPGISINTIQERAKLWRRSDQYFPWGMINWGLIVIDNLQLIRGDEDKCSSREQEIAAILRSLKTLARDLNVPILVLSQLIPQYSKPRKKVPAPPMLSHLRESESIEQVADVIMFLHREDQQRQRNAALEDRAQCIIAKQRNGPTGSVNLRFIPEFARFESP